MQDGHDTPHTRFVMPSINNLQKPFVFGVVKKTDLIYPDFQVRFYPNGESGPEEAGHIVAQCTRTGDEASFFCYERESER